MIMDTSELIEYKFQPEYSLLHLYLCFNRAGDPLTKTVSESMRISLPTALASSEFASVPVNLPPRLPNYRMQFSMNLFVHVTERWLGHRRRVIVLPSASGPSGASSAASSKTDRLGSERGTVPSHSGHAPISRQLHFNSALIRSDPRVGAIWRTPPPPNSTPNVPGARHKAGCIIRFRCGAAGCRAPLAANGDRARCHVGRDVRRSSAGDG